MSTDTHEKVIKLLVNKYKLDERILNVTTRHIFKFIADVMANPDDERAIRLPYIGVFTQKNTINKKKYYSQQTV